MQIQVNFDEYLLMLRAGCNRSGKNRIIKELERDAAACIGYMHMYPSKQESFGIAHPYDQKVFDGFAFAERLLQDQGVKEVSITWNFPTAYQRDAIFAGLGVTPLRASTITSWDSSVLQGHFSGGGYWFDELNRFLESRHDHKSYSVGVRSFESAGRDVIFNPMLRSDTLTARGRKQHPAYCDFVKEMGCLPSYIHLELTA